MKLGICTFPENFKKAAELGYEYLEIPLIVLHDLSDSEFEDTKKEFKDMGISAEVVYSMFGNIKLLGDDALKEQELRRYLSKSFARAAELGTKIAVFGSAGARSRPDYMDEKTAFEQLCAVTKTICDEAAKCGIKVAIEELNSKETNIVNTLKDAQDLINAVDCSNLCCVADTFHILSQENGFESISKHASIIKHAHIACSKDRLSPSNEHAEELAKISAAFRAAGYNGRISVECAFHDFEAQASAAIKVLKQYFR